MVTPRAKLAARILAGLKTALEDPRSNAFHARGFWLEIFEDDDVVIDGHVNLEAVADMVAEELLK